LGFGLALVLIAEIGAAVVAWNAGGIQIAARAAPVAGNVSNIEALGLLLYTRYLLIFEAAGIVLLVAMVGAIVLTRRRRSDVRPQNVSAQVRRRPKDAVKLTQPTVGEGVEI
jgi:NADH-quinone oxidoreductase subunit J